MKYTGILFTVTDTNNVRFFIKYADVFGFVNGCYCAQYRYYDTDANAKQIREEIEELRNNPSLNIERYEEE